MTRLFWRRIGFRLALWYSGIFIASTLVILVVSFVLLRAFLVREDRAVIQSRAEDFVSHFDQNGLDGMLADIRSEMRPGQDSFYIRVLDGDGRVLLTNAEEFPRFQSPGRAVSGSTRGWLRLEADSGLDTLDVLSVVLSDGHALQVGRPSHQRAIPMQRFTVLSLAIAVPVIFLGLVGGALLSFKAFMPVRELIFTVRAITETGQLTGRVPLNDAQDELTELGVLFNLMLDRIHRLVEGMRNALDNVAHDFRTPMTRLRNTAEEALQDQTPGPKHLEALADCLEQSEEAVTMLKTLMDISEAETGTLTLARETMSAAALVESAVDLYRHVADEKRVDLKAAIPSDLSLFCDRYRLRQALANLIDNALKYTPAGGGVRVTAGADGAFTWLCVRDSGMGIPAHELPQIWDRLFRGSNSRNERGLGLGLSFVRAIVHAHGGTVAAAPNDGPGVSITLRLPSVPDSLTQP